MQRRPLFPLRANHLGRRGQGADGAGKAQTAIAHQWDGHTPNANTHNEHADEMFKNVGFGIRAGLPHFMDAECPILRCRFSHCTQAGVSIESFNALDWWIWNCTFDHCRVGVTNDPGAGHFHVYNSLFIGSTEADMKMRNTSNYFGIRHNVSLDSQSFFVAGDIGANAAGITLQGNTILDPQRPRSIDIGSLGPVLLLDNVIKSYVSPAVVFNPLTPYLSAGNTFVSAYDLQGKKLVAALGDKIDKKIIPLTSIKSFLQLLGTAPNLHRPVTEIAQGSDVKAIQAAIMQATKLRGKRPVVHLPWGRYEIAQTLTIPAESDVQIVGDNYDTVLHWAGKGTGPVLRLAGPSKATLRDFTVDGAGIADGIVVNNCDQPGARVFMEQGEGQSSKQNNLLVDGLCRARVELHDFYHSGAGGVSVKAVGGGPESRSSVLIFGGASSNNALSYDVSQGARVLAEDIWYEGAPPGFVHATGSGTFTLDGAEIATGRPGPNQASQNPDFAAVEADNFDGLLALLVVNLGARMTVHGDGSKTNALLMGMGNGDGFWANTSPHAKSARLGSLQYIPNKGAVNVPDQGSADPAWLRHMLAPLRAEQPRPLLPLPVGITDARFYRVNAANCIVGIHLTALP